MIANHSLGLPGGEHPERAKFGNDGLDRGIGTVSHHIDGLSDRKTVEMIFARVEREPLLVRRLHHQDRLTRSNIFAYLRGDDADDAVDGRTQNHLIKTTFKYRNRGGSGLHLRVSNR